MSVLLLCCACADDGAVPAVEPEPGPDPLLEQTEPFLTVSPDTLFYDLSGNPLNAGEFIIKTNCVWRLSVPEQADWFEASATSGRYDAAVSFHLNIDRHYHVAELTFDAIAADGKPVISRSVVIQQGEEPADPSHPDDPADSGKPDDNPDKKPGDDPSNPDNPSDPDTPDNPDKPDNPSDPDKNPEIPPVTPSIPKIESVNPTELVWSVTDSGVTRQVSVAVADFDSHVLQAKISGADADRFEASVNGLAVLVKAVGTNETDTDYRATLEISVEGGNRMTVSLVQSKRESMPDNDDSGGNSDDGSGDNSGSNSGGSSGSSGSDSGGSSGGDSDDHPDDSSGGNGEEGGEPEVPQGGGCDDFSTLTPSSQCKERVTTSSGWTGSHCAVYSGDNGNDSAPYFRSLLGRNSDVRGLAMRNDSANGGRIESPELHGGCGTLKFRYGVTEANKIVDFTVEIVRNGTRVKSWQVRKTVTQYESNVFSVGVQRSGDFRIVIRNNFSSNGAEYTTVFQIAWSGYSGD